MYIVQFTLSFEVETEEQANKLKEDGEAQLAAFKKGIDLSREYPQYGVQGMSFKTDSWDEQDFVQLSNPPDEEDFGDKFRRCIGEPLANLSPPLGKKVDCGVKDCPDCALFNQHDWED